MPEHAGRGRDPGPQRFAIRFEEPSSPPATLDAAAELPDVVAAVVSCGGRLDLLGPSVLERVRVPVLVIEGAAAGGCRSREKDDRLHATVGAAAEHLPRASVAFVTGAEHWFRDADVFPTLAHVTAGWLDRHLAPLAGASARGAAEPAAAAAG